MDFKLADGTHWVGVNDRITDLFESYWPIPDGISYNSYLVQDEETALVDGVKQEFTEDYLDKVSQQTEIEDVDYMIVNHMEPDHTGAFPGLRRLNPHLIFVGTEKTKDLLESFYGIVDGIKVVQDNDVLELGSKSLEFVETPFVHWPETMMTYLEGEDILFSGDGFGAYGALNGGIFDDQVDREKYYEEAIRYLSNIVGAYTSTLQAAMAKLNSFEVKVIAPTHGPIWREEPDGILKLYDRFSNGDTNPGVTIIYGSMYGFTEKVAEHVALGARSTGLKDLQILDAARTHPSYLLSTAWKRGGLIIGSPTYESRAFPPVSNFLRLAEKKKLQNKIVGVFGSYGWGGGSVREMEEAGETLNWEFPGSPVDFGGRPTEKQLEDSFELGRKVAEAVREQE